MLVINVLRVLSLTIPDISVAFLNSPPLSYECFYQGFLPRDNVLPARRRKRQIDSIETTEIFTIIIPIRSTRTIELTNLLPNYIYVVNVSIQTSAGQTPFVTITSPTLIPAGNIINPCLLTIYSFLIAILIMFLWTFVIFV